MLPPSAISVIATASEEHENHNDNQNGCRSFLQHISRGTSLLNMWVRNNDVESLGFYLSGAGGISSVGFFMNSFGTLGLIE